MHARLLEVQRATESFHERLSEYLRDERHVMQTMFTSNMELYEDKEAFMNAHYELANAHERLLDAYHELFVWQARRHPPHVIPDVSDRDDIRVRRTASATQAVGFTTPPRPSVRRQLFPDTPDLFSYETL